MYNPKFPFLPAGDQENAIKNLIAYFKNGSKKELLLGATGTGKTFVMANVIKALEKPTLIMAHNKTLAGQLYGEFVQFFPKDKVGYFISFYDYYQPEAYIPTTDTYIEKDATRNDDIDRMRHFATTNLIEHKNTIIVASVSCIYGIGSPETYSQMRVELQKNEEYPIKKLALDLIEIQYERTNFDLSRGKFRITGDIVDIFPAHETETVIRISYFDDEIESITEINALDGEKVRNLKHINIFPSSHYVAKRETLEKTIKKIEKELGEQLFLFQKQNKLIEHQRLKERIEQDIAMLKTTGYCNGIENYSRYLTNRNQGEAPPCLIDYFGKDFLTIIDESHVSLPQVRGMFNGDRARKQILVDFGFRLPSALDNRPLDFEEFYSKLDQVLFVSATPSDFEKQESEHITELINRPTGLLDPLIEVKPAKTEIETLFDEITKEIAKKGKVLVSSLTKKMAEDLTDFFNERGIRSKYLHSDIDSLERLKIIMDLRKNIFDVLVGVNLLREGLDIPEVSLVAILDADKQGFLRSESSLIQTIGRAARNKNGRAILFGNTIKPNMLFAINETIRRRKIQENFNKKNGIIPTTINGKTILNIEDFIPGKEKKNKRKLSKKIIRKKITELEKEMKKAAKEWDFEYAAILRDKIFEYKSTIKE